MIYLNGKIGQIFWNGRSYKKVYLGNKLIWSNNFVRAVTNTCLALIPLATSAVAKSLAGTGLGSINNTNKGLGIVHSASKAKSDVLSPFEIIASPYAKSVKIPEIDTVINTSLTVDGLDRQAKAINSDLSSVVITGSGLDRQAKAVNSDLSSIVITGSSLDRQAKSVDADLPSVIVTGSSVDRETKTLDIDSELTTIVATGIDRKIKTTESDLTSSILTDGTTISRETSLSDVDSNISISFSAINKVPESKSIITDQDVIVTPIIDGTPSTSSKIGSNLSLVEMAADGEASPSNISESERIEEISLTGTSIASPSLIGLLDLGISIYAEATASISDSMWENPVQTEDTLLITQVFSATQNERTLGVN